ncbi:MAG: Rieske 2Fe-2S domain-containing protein [Bacteroidales bacterium]
MPFNVKFDIGTQLDNITDGQYVFIGPEDCSQTERCGYGGLIIFRASTNNYKAFDRACPFNPKEKCILEPFEGDKSNNILSCPCCGSLFDLGDNGRNIHGPSTRGLQQYQVGKSGNQITVWN